MDNPIFLLVGKSASGKTTIAEILESQYNLKTVQSYTTRPKRHEDETGHTFISDAEFDLLEDIVAYTEYNNYRYCATTEQIDDADIYVVDVPGVEVLLENYNSNRPIVILYFDANIRTRIDRMLGRHDCDAQIVSRLYTDEEFDWKNLIEDLIWDAEQTQTKSIKMYCINANRDLDEVLFDVKEYISKNGVWIL